jgi:hypothetical protein
VPASEFRGNLELIEGAIPLAQHAQQLEQEHAQLGVVGACAYLILEARQRVGRRAGSEELFSR